MNKLCFIMRGLPGSGKSSVAATILMNLYEPGMIIEMNTPSDAEGSSSIMALHEKSDECHRNCIGRIHSTDNYFYDVNGNYNFNPSFLKQFHDSNYAAFVRDVKNNVKLLIVDNTNSMTWEWKKYHEEAINAGYMTSIIEIPHSPPELCFSRTTHGVPLETIRKMKERWQPTQ
mgnify:FL=1